MTKSSNEYRFQTVTIKGEKKIKESILFCYDTLEKDLARDIKDFLCEIGVENTIMIPLEADRGLTLQDKETKYIDSARGIIFLLTPGTERLEQYFPSPSVTEEMGQAKQKFSRAPERIIYLKDVDCHIQSVDQRSYIPFNKKDVRSIIECLTLLVKNLKESRLLAKKDIEPQKTPGVNITELASTLSWELKEICFDLSGEPNGAMRNNEFNQHLKSIYQMGARDINFIKRDLQLKGLAKMIKSVPPYSDCWTLTNVGWEIARFKVQQEDKAGKKSVNDLVKAIVAARLKAVPRKAV